MSNVVVFDLDDTLYQEIDYVKSGFRQVASFLGDSSLSTMMMSWFITEKDVFQSLNDYLHISVPIDTYLSIYRNHVPDIHLSETVQSVLKELKDKGCILGLISDGRSITQRNKIAALGLYSYINDENIVISEETGAEKPAVTNYSIIMDRYPGSRFFYIGDNPEKDFIAPNELHWITIQLIGDNNIHPVKDYYPDNYLPDIKVLSFMDLLAVIR